MYTKTVDVLGETLTIRFDGRVWISPHDNQRHSRAEAAMRSELGAFLQASGDNPKDDVCAALIDECLARME